MMVRDVVRDCLEKDAAERTENDIGKLKCSVMSGQRNAYQGFLFLVSIRHTVEKVMKSIYTMEFGIESLNQYYIHTISISTIIYIKIYKDDVKTMIVISQISILNDMYKA
jgi:hypothetical protein